MALPFLPPGLTGAPVALTGGIFEGVNNMAAEAILSEFCHKPIRISGGARMKTTLAIMVIMAFLVSGAGLVLAQSAQDPAKKEPAGAAQEPGPGQDAGAAAKVAGLGLKGAKKPAGNRYAPAGKKKGVGAAKSGKGAQSANLVQPGYSVSPGVKRDRRLRIDAAFLKPYADPDLGVGEAFWVTERDGALMMVDPHISQSLH
jgi:hypothetical protein